MPLYVCNLETSTTRRPMANSVRRAKHKLKQLRVKPFALMESSRKNRKDTVIAASHSRIVRGRKDRFCVSLCFVSRND